MRRHLENLILGSTALMLAACGRPGEQTVNQAAVDAMQPTPVPTAMPTEVPVVEEQVDPFGGCERVHENGDGEPLVYRKQYTEQGISTCIWDKVVDTPEELCAQVGGTPKGYGTGTVTDKDSTGVSRNVLCGAEGSADIEVKDEFWIDHIDTNDDGIYDDWKIDN